MSTGSLELGKVRLRNMKDLPIVITNSSILQTTKYLAASQVSLDTLSIGEVESLPNRILALAGTILF